MLSIVIPAFEEGDRLISQLIRLFESHPVEDCIVVDASDANTVDKLRLQIEQLFPNAPLQYLKATQKGRAAQMNQGASHAQGSTLLFLHADTRLPEDALHTIMQGMTKGWQWGRFDVRFDNSRWPFRMIALMMNKRSRKTSIATGDQAMFMSRAAFDLAGGFDQIPLMEDIALSKKLKRLGPPLCLYDRVITDARRWEQKGIVKTIVLMWWLRFAYFMGVPAEKIAHWYR